MKAIIYKTPTCAYCQMVNKYLTSKGVECEFVDISENQELALKLQKLTGATTVPITKLGRKYIVGWNISKLNEALK